MNDLNKPLVSICCTTYNHENFIRKCLDGFLIQQTNFSFEILIFDDASIDNTQTIIKEYVKKNRNIKTFLQKENQWSKGKYGLADWLFPAAAGKYIALCEGDDYWTDPFKLQKQVDFLENNKECVLCFHKSNKVRDTEKTKQKEDFYPKDVILNVLNEEFFFDIPTIPTASVMFSNRIKFPEIYHSHGDFILYCTLLSHGKAGYIDEVMSVYKLHEGGVSSNYDSNSYLERRIKELEIEGKFKEFSFGVRNQISRILTKHIVYYLNKNRGNLSFSNKIGYFKILLGQKAFYNISFKEYMTLVKTLLK